MNIIKLILLIPTALLILGTGTYLSIKLKWLQIFKFPYAISLLWKKENKNRFSSLAALFTILGGNLGVGNISGTAIALKTGGPGFILWMIIVIMTTSVIKYVTCYLSIKKCTQHGVGGPVAYIAEAFNFKQATILFSFFMLIAAITVGNLVQVNSLSIPLKTIDIPVLTGGIAIAIIFFIITALSLHKIKTLMSVLVPLMTVSYILLCSIVLFTFNKNLIPAIQLIVSNFFTMSSFQSGCSFGIILEILAIMQVGALRAIFATDIGLGLEGIVHSSIVSHKNSDKFTVEQSLITIISPIIVALIALTTTMVLLVTDSWVTDLESTNMCIFAFKKAIGSLYIDYFIIAIMFCFALTTIFTWFFCAQQTIRYISPHDIYIKIWGIIFTIIIPFGAISRVQLLWDIADISISILLFINIFAILKLVFHDQEAFIVSNQYFEVKSTYQT